jgi:Immunity protein Imm1
MYVSSMVTDEWRGVRNIETEVEGPSEADAERAILALNASTHTLVLFLAEGEKHMAVGGGNGQYIVYITSDNVQFSSLAKNASVQAGQVEVFVGGQKGGYERRFVVDCDAEVRAAQHFVRTGTADPGQTWVMK